MSVVRTGVAHRALSRAPIEWLWGGLGVGAAATSTAFAAYMLAFGPAQPNPQDNADFGIFAHVRPRTHAAWAENTPPSGRISAPARSPGSEGIPPGPDPQADVDLTPTGSVPVGKRPNADTTLPVGKVIASQPTAALPSFILRDVFDGKALVESRTALSLVAPGSVLDGAGEVLSIERRGNGWVVMTTRGLIGTK